MGEQKTEISLYKVSFEFIVVLHADVSSLLYYAISRFRKNFRGASASLLVQDRHPVFVRIERAHLGSRCC